MSYTIKQSPEDFIVDEIINLKLEDNGRYSYFLLKKRNWNTEDTIQKSAFALHVQRSRINACGNKDKIAVTTQYISVENLNSSMRTNQNIGEIELRYVGQGNIRMNLGSHDGNRFQIIVRDFEGTPKKDVTRIKNYFGSQRFSNNNHLVGRAIIKKDFKKASELILENHGEHEWIVKEHLEKNPNDFVGAMRKIPKKIMSLYINSYQSFIFNSIAKELDFEENIKIPLIGFGTVIPDKSVKPLLEKIMEEEQIIFRDFIIRQFPEISSEGIERELYMEVKDFRIERIGEKDYSVSFILGKGSYATTVVEYVFG
jgi:tRNA pseudouridine13 synthase